MVVIPGFDSVKVGPRIEMPDMGQLLLEPFFYDTDLDSAYDNASDFQKLLFNSIPNLGENGKRHVSVLAEVRLLGPSFRACTVPGQEGTDGIDEWHIDNEEDEDGWKVWAEPRDIVHLYTSQTSAMTQFMDRPLILPQLESTMDYDEFMAFFQNNINSFNLNLVELPAYHMTTFTNHLHRATDPTRYEFRYMFRVVETDRVRAPSEYNPNRNASTVTDVNNEQTVNIERDTDGTIIIIPPGDGVVIGVNNEISVPTSNPTTVEKEIVTETKPEAPQVQVQTEVTSEAMDFENELVKKAMQEQLNNLGSDSNLNVQAPKPLQNPISTEKFTEMNIELIGWMHSFVSENSILRNFSPKNSIMFATKGNYDPPALNRNLLDFFKNIEKTVYLIDEEGNRVRGKLDYDFYDKDANLGEIAGAHITFSGLQLRKIKPGATYKVEFNQEGEYRYIIPDAINKVTIPEDFSVS